MKAKDLLEFGIPASAHPAAFALISHLFKQDCRNETFVRSFLWQISDSPTGTVLAYSDGEKQPEMEALAVAIIESRRVNEFLERDEPAPFEVWGSIVDDATREQMANVARLPITVAAALMPDAHLGYGIPIGGVVATENQVIPYGVGSDIACRMALTVTDLEVDELGELDQRDRLRSALEEQTRFGTGACFEEDTYRDHPVLDDPRWGSTSLLRGLKDRARKQLGSSGSGNHFVEWGFVTLSADIEQATVGNMYVALLSHSGSRGPGYQICAHYTKIAQQQNPELPPELKHLAWLDLDGEAGSEYWEAMSLMGDYAQANHEAIHGEVLGWVGADMLARVENHHNFAWIETHGGKSVVVHRKGATPASRGELGVIPGTMGDVSHLVIGLGCERSMRSAAHGAGRLMSRTAATKSFVWSAVEANLRLQGIEVLSAGADEAPGAYKPIATVMADQEDLVRSIGTFRPQLVKMAPPQERRRRKEKPTKAN